MVSWATLVAIVFFMVLAALISNISVATTEKIESQNAADAAAYSGSTWMARGMNAVTAANHMVGELTSLYVLHHALGGKWLDEEGDKENETREIRSTNRALRFAYEFASAVATVPVPSYVYDTVHDDDPKADQESTIYQAKLRLKQLLTAAFAAHASGGIMTWFPWTYAAGMALQYAAYAAELKIYQEYVTLNLVERLALSLRDVKRNVLPQVMDILLEYERAVVSLAPVMAAKAAVELGEKHEARGLMAPLQMPLVPEPTDDETKSQLIRASFPWTHCWRGPILTILGKTCWLSRAETYYGRWSNEYSLRICEQFRTPEGEETRDGPGRGYRLYVIEDLNVSQVDKGQEPWTKLSGSLRAEELFCHIGLARREPPHVWATPFFRQGNPDGVVTFAQSMIYNANPQEPQRRHPGKQPVAGWDTLNWAGDAVEWKATPTRNPPTPGIKLNWQARLSAVTPSKFSWLQGQPLGDSQIEHVIDEKMSPSRNYGKSLFTH